VAEGRYPHGRQSHPLSPTREFYRALSRHSHPRHCDAVDMRESDIDAGAVMVNYVVVRKCQEIAGHCGEAAKPIGGERGAAVGFVNRRSGFNPLIRHHIFVHHRSPSSTSIRNCQRRGFIAALCGAGHI
jgi:hypothetical protein